MVVQQSYKLVRGIHYNSKTPDAVVRCLERSRKEGQRIRIFYGDRETGRDWLNLQAFFGYVSSCNATPNFPHLFLKRSSKRGIKIHDENIVRIMARVRVWVSNGRGGKYAYRWEVAYQHPNYHQPEWKVVEQITSYAGIAYYICDPSSKRLIFGFRKEKDAHKFLAFIKGERQTRW